MSAPQPWSRPPSGPKHVQQAVKKRPVWPWFVFGFAAVLVAVIALLNAFPGSLSDTRSQVSFTYTIILLVVIGAGALVQWSQQPRKALRDAGIWAVIVGALVLVYSVRHEAGVLYDRIASDFSPGVARSTSDGVIITAIDNGHFVVVAEVNGTPVRFLVDTGASDVALSQRDAERIGFDPDQLQFTRVYNTANGTVRGAPVRLGEIRIGDIVVRDVGASVNEGGLSKSLLGMTYLNRLSSYSFEGGRLTLRP